MSPEEIEANLKRLRRRDFWLSNFLVVALGVALFGLIRLALWLAPIVARLLL